MVSFYWSLDMVINLQLLDGLMNYETCKMWPKKLYICFKFQTLKRIKWFKNMIEDVYELNCLWDCNEIVGYF